MCDENSWQIATKVRRYSDGFGKIVNFFRRTFVDIATMTLSFKKKFFFYMKYGITILHVIWYTILYGHITM
jgi:hypothetical protein